MTYEDNSTKYANPNGNPKDNQGYYTQKTRAYEIGYVDYYNDMTEERQKMNPIERDAVEYDNWYDMHSGSIQWFDTAACWAGPFVGETNKIEATPTNVKYYMTDPKKTYTEPAREAEAG